MNIDQSTARFVAAFARLTRGGLPPSFRELMRALQIRSSNGVAYHMKRAAKAGLIDPGPKGRSRVARLTDKGRAVAARSFSNLTCISTKDGILVGTFTRIGAP